MFNCTKSSFSDSFLFKIKEDKISESGAFIVLIKLCCFTFIIDNIFIPVINNKPLLAY